VLTAVGGTPVRTLAELGGALEGGTGADVVLEIRRGEERLLAVVRVPEKRNGRWGGELPKAWLGVRTQVLTPELAAAVGAAGTPGFRVTEVYPWTEAARAGLAVGDLLLGLDGEPFDATRPQDGEDLRRAVEELGIGDPARLAVRRDGRSLEVAVALEARPLGAEEARRSRQEEFEFSVRELTFLDRIEQHWERDQSGVVVTDVTSGGWAHMAGLKTGDLVTAVGEARVADVAGFEGAMKKVVAARPAVVALHLRRGPRTHFVFLEPDWKDVAGGAQP
jgi:serine protease Do